MVGFRSVQTVRGQTWPTNVWTHSEKLLMPATVCIPNFSTGCNRRRLSDHKYCTVQNATKCIYTE